MLVTAITEDPPTNTRIVPEGIGPPHTGLRHVSGNGAGLDSPSTRLSGRPSRGSGSGPPDTSVRGDRIHTPR